MRKSFVYPFSAIVGQEQMKKALMLNAINTKIGGVLLRGEKGTAKSMAVRALAQLLPTIKIVKGCPFNCNPDSENSLCDNCMKKIAKGEELEYCYKQVPVVELPIGATEDRVVGTLDIEKAIKSGEKHFEPGLLAAANRGILYVDEVNLLDDHLVDVLLDAAAMGFNYIEREGISFRHPSGFILVGTMNPEEGELRPQLLDRFGLAVEISGISDREKRAEVINRRISFEASPETFLEESEDKQESLREHIKNAKDLLGGVTLNENLLNLITQISTDFGVDGHRADIVIYKTAVTIASYDGRTKVNKEDIKEAASLALPHRRRRQPFEEPGIDQNKLDESVENWQENNEDEQGKEPEAGNEPENNRQESQEQPEQDQKQPEPQNANEESSEGSDDSSNVSDNHDGSDNHDDDNSNGNSKEQLFSSEEPYRVKNISVEVRDEIERTAGGRRSRSRTDSKSGRYVGSATPKSGKVTDIALDATLRAAAPNQKTRFESSGRGNALLLEKQDLRQKVRETKVGSVIMFALDASGSMAVEERMSAAKGAINSLLIDAYQRRDKVGLVIFRGKEADLVLKPTASVYTASKCLADLPTGGRTPLASGLKEALEGILNYKSLNKNAIPLLVLISDGRANASINGGDPVEEAKMFARKIKDHKIKTIVIDTEQSFISFGMVKQIADELDAKYLKLEDIKAEPITKAIKDSMV